jgi:hypothetical protein
MFLPPSTVATELFRESSMAFAVEAQKLLGVSLEGSVGSTELTLPECFPLLARGWIFSMRRGYMVPFLWERGHRYR